MSTKMDNIDLNFTLNARAVEQSGKALQKSLETGLGAVDFNDLRRNANRTFAQMGNDLKKSLNQKIEFDTTEIDKKLTQLHSKRLTMERQLAIESAKMQDVGGKKQGFFAKAKMRFLGRIRKEEQRLIKMKQQGMEKLNKLATKHVAIMKKAGSGKGGMLGKLGIGGGKGGGIMKMMGGGKGGGIMKMMGGLGKMGKMLGPIMAVLGPMGAVIGGVVAGLGSLVAVIGAAVGIFMGLVAVVMAADSKMKEFNKDILSTVGGADMLGKGFDGATKSIDNMRDAAIKAQFRLGSLAKDNIKVLTTLHEHGYTIREISKDATSAVSAIGAYTKAMSLVMTTSRMIGESATTVAQNMATSADDLGMTLQQVAEKFSTIGRFAMESGFSTKRFFSMVIQATSGMSMYNVRLEEAAGMLVRIGKILGQKTGGEFLQSLTKGFVDKSMTDRIKQVKLAGTGNTQNTMEQSANNTADAFIQKMQGNQAMKGMKMSDLGIDGFGDQTMGDLKGPELVAALKNLDPADQAKLVSKFHMEAMKHDQANADGLMRQFKVLTDISVGSKGGLLNMAKNIDSLDMGGKLNMLRNSMKTMFPGKEIHELSTLQLAALENATGMQGEQLKQMRNLTASFDGNFQTLSAATFENANGTKMTAEQIKEAQQAQVRAFGAYKDAATGEIRAATINSEGEISEKRKADGSMQLIEDLEGYYNSQGASVKANMEAANFNEDRAIAQEIATNTFSIADMIGAGVTSVLNMIYKAVMSIVKNLWGSQSNEATAAATQGEMMQNAAEAMKRAAAIQSEISKKTRAAKGEKDEGKRNAMFAEIEELGVKKDKQTRMAMEAEYMADNIFDASGNVDTGVLNQSNDAKTFFKSNAARHGNVDYEGGKGALTGDIERRMKADKDFQASLAEATPALQSRVSDGEARERTTENQKFSMNAVRTGIAINQLRQNAPQRSRNSDQNKTAHTILDGDGQPIQNPRAGNHVQGGATETLSVNAGPLNVTREQANSSYRDFHGQVSDPNAPMVSSSMPRGDNILDFGYDWLGAVSADSNMLNPAANGSGAEFANTRPAPLNSDGSIATNQDFRDANLEHNLVIDSETENASRTSGGALATYRTHQPTSATNVGSKDTVHRPSNANLHEFRGGSEQIGAVLLELQKLGVDLKTSVDTQVVDNTGIIPKSASQATHYADGRTAPATRNTPMGDEVDSFVAGGTQGHTPSATSSQGTDLAGFYQEMKNAIMDVGAKKEDGSDYTLADLQSDLKEHLAEVGTESLTGASFEQYLQTERTGPWKDIEKNREAVVKMLVFAKKQEDLMKALKENTGSDKAKKDAAQNIMGYLGRGGDTTSINRLADGKSLDGQALTTLRAKLYDEEGNVKDQALRQGLLDLGIKLPSVQDFFYQGGSHGGVITPIHGQDSLIGMRPRGPVDNAMNRGGGGGGNIIVEVHSDIDLQKVKRAIFEAARQVGVGGRVQNRAGKGNFGGGASGSY